MVDFERANQLADRISRGENSGLHKELVSVCMPYFFYLRGRFGYNGISSDDIKKELAISAVSMAISIKAEKGKPFTICLQNTFRDCCRELLKIIDKTRLRKILDKIKKGEIEPRATIGGGRKQISPVFEAQKKEEIEAVRKELVRHKEFSKKVVIRKMRGTTYEEIALSLNEPYNECKKVFWDNLNAMRKNLRNFYKKEDYYTM